MAVPRIQVGSAMKRFNSSAVKNEPGGSFIAEDVRRNIERRAVEAAIWGMPIVSVAAMRQAYLSETGGIYGDILYFSKPPDWRFQMTSPNASSLYVYFNFNLKEGPIVLEFPAATGARLSGTIEDAWQTPLRDVGSECEDQGLDGNYLFLPPGYNGVIPESYFAVQSPTLNGYAVFRSVPANESTGDLDKLIALMKNIRVFPFNQAAAPPERRYIDISGKLFDGIVRYDHTFYDGLARMVNEEPVQERDLVAMAELRTLGIEKGKEFKPDPAMRDILIKSISESHAMFMRNSSEGEPWWPDSQWMTPAIAALGAETEYSYRTCDGLAIDERAANFFLACAFPKKTIGSTFYIAAYRDAKGLPLQGGRTYRLRVPSSVPARHYWNVTAYDQETSAFIRDAPTLSIDSWTDVQKNADGSVDVYFGPTTPVGKESNWICTARGRPWFAAFRVYGPDQAILDKTWRLAEIEEATHHARLIWRV